MFCEQRAYNLFKLSEYFYENLGLKHGEFYKVYFANCYDW